MKFTDKEIKEILRHPVALKLAAEYHDYQATLFDGIGEWNDGIKINEDRSKELIAEYERLNREGGMNEDGHLSNSKEASGDSKGNN